MANVYTDLKKTIPFSLLYCPAVQQKIEPSPFFDKTLSNGRLEVLLTIRRSISLHSSAYAGDHGLGRGGMR